MAGRPVSTVISRPLLLLAATAIAGLAGVALVFAGGSGLNGGPTLNVFGPELPFMFPTSEKVKDFSWSQLIASGDTGVGTISNGAGEVIGIDGAFYVATAGRPTPRPVTNEQTPTGAVVTFVPQKTLTLTSPVDLARLQSVLDKLFVDTDTYVYMFKAHGTLSSVEYQLAGPKPTDEIRDGIKSGMSQQAVTIGTPKYIAKNVPGTLVGIRAPTYLNTVFEVPYHIHFLADDKSLLGHVTALEATGLDIAWARSEAISLRYWGTE
jgi:alpha-acetolactate decarboxylase